MGFLRGIRTATVVCAVCAFSNSALAQDSASAEALFETGKALLDDGKAVEACPKLEESLKLDDAIGTRFQLARCYEAVGRTASAWSFYLDVAARAKSAGQLERETFARNEAARLKPALSKLTISVPADARAPGLEVTRGGVPVGSGQWELALPVDPGTIEITAKAPGKRPWSGRVTVAARESSVFKLPTLENAPRALGVRGGAGGKAAHGLTSLQWVGIGAGGLGVVGLGIGGVFALRAKSKNDDSGCSHGECPTSAALSLNSDARSAGNVATVSMIAGGVLLATGVTLFLVAPSRREGGPGSAATARLEPLVGVGFGGARVGGTF